MIDIPDKLIEQFSSAKSVAVLTGAGVSAESGIATFRDPDGLWSKFNPAELASAKGFMSNPELVWEWYNHRRKVVYDTTPNPGHHAIAEMEGLFDDFTLITQNVDGLHEIAGSKNIHELHGSIIKNHCFSCGTPYNAAIDLESKQLPACECGGQIRPSVVWFGEMLPEKALSESEKAAMRADIFISAGTSGEVYPAAGLPGIAKRHGALTIDVNKTKSLLSSSADYFLEGSSGEVFPMLLAKIKEARGMSD